MARRMVSRLPAVALTALVLAAVVAAPASAALPRSFFGVSLHPPAFDPGVSLTAQMRGIAATGAGTVTLSFEWLHAQPTARGPVDFTRSDAAVGAAARAGLGVLPVVVTTPPWAALTPGEAFSPPADPTTYAAYLRALVDRYGPRGTFWTRNPSLPRRPIRGWQVWNEPVGGERPDGASIFWVDSRPFAPTYVALLRAARAAVRAADPGADVVLAGLVGRSWETLTLLYAAGARGQFDAVSLHPYTGRPGNVLRAVGLVRAAMRAAGDANVPILVTEVGWPSFAPDLSWGDAGVRRHQAWWLSQVVPQLARARTRLGIGGVVWNTWITRDRDPANAFDHSGLVRLQDGGRVVPKRLVRTWRRVVGAELARR